MGRWVHFRLKADNVRNDQSVAIIGDDSPLGDWSVKRPGWYPIRLTFLKFLEYLSFRVYFIEFRIWEL